MDKVLFINSCDNDDQDAIKIGRAFISEYEKRHTGDEIISINLYEDDLKFLSFDDKSKMLELNYEENKDNEIYKYVNDFITATKIVIVSPFVNLSIPAILHAYLEYIAIKDVTYKDSLKGTIGLCQGKKIVHIVERPTYSSKVEYGDSYLRAFFAGLGIKDFRTIAMEGTDVHTSHSEAFLKRSIDMARSLAEVW